MSQRQCDRWNKQCAVGSLVRFYPVTGRAEYRLRRTRSEAYMLSGHTAVVFLEGESGCVALDNVKQAAQNESEVTHGNCSAAARK
jgi:hypothetical protein